MTFTEQLIEMGACPAAIEFSKGKTLEQAWNECQYGDWMMWLYARCLNFDVEAYNAFCEAHRIARDIHINAHANDLFQPKAAEICRKYLPLPILK